MKMPQKIYKKNKNKNKNTNEHFLRSKKYRETEVKAKPAKKLNKTKK